MKSSATSASASSVMSSFLRAISESNSSNGPENAAWLTSKTGMRQIRAGHVTAHGTETWSADDGAQPVHQLRRQLPHPGGKAGESNRQQQQRQHDGEPEVALFELVARLLPPHRIAAEGEDHPAEIGRRKRDQADHAQRSEDDAICSSNSRGERVVARRHSAGERPPGCGRRTTTYRSTTIALRRRGRAQRQQRVSHRPREHRSRHMKPPSPPAVVQRHRLRPSVIRRAPC